jgi:hypothetical protein
MAFHHRRILFLIFFAARRLAAGLIGTNLVDDVLFVDHSSHHRDNMSAFANETAVPPTIGGANETINATITNGSDPGSQPQQQQGVDTMSIVKQVFVILAIGVLMSLLLLLFTYLQLRYCKNCWPPGPAPSSSSSPTLTGRRRRRTAAVDTGIVSEANLQGMTAQERLDVVNHVFRFLITTRKTGGSRHPVHDRDLEAGDAPSPSFHTVSKGGESGHLPDDGAWDVHESNAAGCSICLSAFRGGQRILETKCGHAFHHACCETWLQKRDTCPYCRSDLYSSDELRQAAIEVLGQERVDQLGPKGDADLDKPQNPAASASSSSEGDAEAGGESPDSAHDLSDDEPVQAETSVPNAPSSSAPSADLQEEAR